jgi:hypothetical protein
MKPLAVSVKQTTELVPFGRTKINQMIKTGELESVLVGGRRMILMSGIEKLLELNVLGGGKA